RAADITQRCIASVLGDTRVPDRVLVMDNGGGEASAFNQMRQSYETESRVRFRGIGENLGFAAACEVAFDELLAVPDLQAVLLINNDCEVEPGFVEAMANALDADNHIDMVAAQMVPTHQPEAVDSLGITFFSCGIAANRQSIDEPLLGPCGGAALYSARLLRDLRERTGQCFEPRYFCYAEDTDLAIRARLLGYRASYAPTAVARHIGSAASGGSDTPFVMYHGLRNSLSTLARCM